MKRPRLRDVLAVLLLLAGVLLTPLGSLAGLALLWESPTWTVREKLAGTLIPFVTFALIMMTFFSLGTHAAPTGGALPWRVALGAALVTVTLTLTARLTLSAVRRHVS